MTMSRNMTSLPAALQARAELPGICSFSLDNGWQHTMSILEAEQAAQGGQKHRKVCMFAHAS